MFLIGISGKDGGFDPLVLIIMGLVVEALVGGTSFRNRWSGAPNNLINRYIAWCDKKLNRENRTEQDKAIRGGLSILSLIIIVSGIGWIIGSLSQEVRFVWIFEVLLIAMLIEQCKTYVVISRTTRGLKSSNLEAARRHLSSLVHVPLNKIDSHGIARMGVEAMASTLVKAVVAPIFWYVLFGLPGMLVCSSVSVMNEYIEDETGRHRSFGFAAARLESIFMFVPARLAGILVVFASLFVPTIKPLFTIRGILRDVGRCRMYSVGWPLSAMAGALNVALSIPPNTSEQSTDQIWVGPGDVQTKPGDMGRGLYLFCVACLINAGLVTMLVISREL